MKLFDSLPRAAEGDRGHLFAVADFFIDLAEQARREGILALDEYIDRDGQTLVFSEKPQFTPEEEWLFAMLLGMVTDGVDYEIVLETAQYALEASTAEGGARLALMIGAEGAHQLQIGMNPTVMQLGFAAMMGFPLGKAYRSHCEEARRAREQAVKDQYATPPANCSVPENWDTEAVTVETASGEKLTFEDITRLTDRSVQKMLREVDQTDLARALKCASGEAWSAVMRNISPRAAAMLKDDVEFMGPVRIIDVQASQRAITNVIRRQRESGATVFSSETAEEAITQSEIDELLDSAEVPPKDNAE